MTELEAAPTLIGSTDGLFTQLRDGLITPDEYQAALPTEDAPHCLHCDQPAVIDQTCAEHVSLVRTINAVRAVRPLVDLSRCSTPQTLITAVMAALEKAGREKFAGRFAERAEQATGMNGLCMIAREYVRLESSL